MKFLKTSQRVIYLKLNQTNYVMKRGFSRANEVLLNFMASDELKVISNYLRTEKEFSRPNEVLLNFMASDIFKVISNYLRTEKKFSRPNEVS